MALTFPIDPGKPGRIEHGPGAWSAVVSWGNAYRALEAGFAVLMPGHFVGEAWQPAASIGEIDGVVLGWTHPAAQGAFGVVAVPRDAEIADAYLAYGTLDRDAANARLAELGIIVRPAIFAPET